MSERINITNPPTRSDDVESLSYESQSIGLLSLARRYFTLEDGQSVELQGSFGSGLVRFPPEAFAANAEEAAKCDTFADDLSLDESRRPSIRRLDSLTSEMDPLEYEPDDPKITGQGVNDIDEQAWREDFTATNHRPPDREEVRQWRDAAMARKRICIIRLGEAFMKFGAPTHRLDGIMLAARHSLDISAEFIFFPYAMITNFGDAESPTSFVHITKISSRLDLGRLATAHWIYKKLARRDLGIEEAARRLGKLLDSSARPCYGPRIRCVLGALCSMIICGLAFGGSVADMGIAFIFGALLNFLQLSASRSSLLYSMVFEYFGVMIIGFTGQALASIQNSRIFCYQAVTTAGVVSLLPGFLILSSAQELASKKIMSGSVKMVYANVASLLLGFALELGSFLLLAVMPSERRLQAKAVQALAPPSSLTGKYYTDITNVTAKVLEFTYYPPHTLVTPAENHFVSLGCYRPPDVQWWNQTLPWWTVLILVPLYSLTSSSWNLQPYWRTKPLFAMIFISCCSYFANHWAGLNLPGSGIAQVIGALCVGTMGNLYSRIFAMPAYPAMVPGVLFLIPSGLTSVGAADANTGITLQILQVSIGVTIGLFLASFAVYGLDKLLPAQWGGRRSKNKEAIFAF